MWQLIFENEEDAEKAFNRTREIIENNDAKTIKDGYLNLAEYFDIDSLPKEKQEILFILITSFLSFMSYKE